MNDFQYLNPCKVIFGKDRVNEVAEVVALYGKRILFVYGQNSIKSTGVYGRIVKLLKSANIDFIEHAGVKPNPILTHAVKGVELAKKYKVDCVLAVGGGSVIDESKVIAFAAMTDDDPWSFFSHKIRPQKALPVVVVLTISGTGSEMNSGAVLTNEETKEKLGISAWCIIPKASILDPSLTFTVPKKLIVYGFIDAFSHVLEGYFNGETLCAAVQDEMAEGLFRSIIKSSLNVLSDPQNYAYRADAMWSSCLAHNGLLNAGRGKILHEVHCIAHILSALFDIPHGAAVSVAMPAWMQFRMDKLCSKINQFGRNVFTLENAGGRDLTHPALSGLKSWLRQIGSPLSLMELGVDKSHIPLISEKLRSACLKGMMRDVTEKQAYQLVELLF